jgi:two-component system response regulator DesR
MSEMIRVVLADDETLFGEAITALLDLEPDITIAATAADGRAAVKTVARERPDIAVLDLEMPHLDGIEAAATIMSNTPGTRVVLLTRHARPAVLRRALEAGTAGFVTKTTSITDLPRILRTVHAGGRYIDSSVADSALTEARCPLTDRELDVLRESIDGATLRTISERTHLAPGTVRNYASTAMTKLAADTRVHAARIAWQEGWI